MGPGDLFWVEVGYGGFPAEREACEFLEPLVLPVRAWPGLTKVT